MRTNKEEERPVRKGALSRIRHFAVRGCCPSDDWRAAQLRSSNWGPLEQAADRQSRAIAATIMASLLTHDCRTVEASVWEQARFQTDDPAVLEELEKMRRDEETEEPRWLEDLKPARWKVKRLERKVETKTKKGHQWHQSGLRRIHWPICAKCGLIGLRNKATRREGCWE